MDRMKDQIKSPNMATDASSESSVTNQSSSDPVEKRWPTEDDLAKHLQAKENQQNETMQQESKPGSWQRLITWLDKPEQLGKDQLNFLPAALEIQETPPPPAGRAIVWSIVILFVLAVIWGIFGKVDVVAVAQGKIIPSDRVKVVQPLESGVIKNIHVKEGQLIKQGDALITLDSTQSTADFTRLEQELSVTRQQALRLSQFREFLTHNKIYKRESSGNNKEAPQSENKLNQQPFFLLQQQIQHYQAQQQNFNEEIEKRKAEQQTQQAQLIKIQRTLPLLKERSEGFELLLKDNVIARHQYLELQQAYIEKQQDLEAQKARLQEIAFALKSLYSENRVWKAETRQTNLLELQEAKIKISSMEQELIKARQRNQQQLLVSPIEGTVQQLAVHTIGGVVTPAQELMLIVPTEANFEVEAMLPNKDIGFVTEQQSAEVKLEAFPFTKYGVIDATISHISDDAIADENLGLVFMVKGKLKKNKIQVNQRLVNITPGMAATIEIKTGKRRLIEYFVAPLLRYRQESIRER